MSADITQIRILAVDDRLLMREGTAGAISSLRSLRLEMSKTTVCRY